MANPFSLLSIANDPSLTQRTVNADKSARAFDQAAMERVLANRGSAANAKATNILGLQKALIGAKLPYDQNPNPRLRTMADSNQTGLDLTNIKVGADIGVRTPNILPDEGLAAFAKRGGTTAPLGAGPPLGALVNAAGKTVGTKSTVQDQVVPTGKGATGESQKQKVTDTEVITMPATTPQYILPGKKSKQTAPRQKGDKVPAKDIKGTTPTRQYKSYKDPNTGKVYEGWWVQNPTTGNWNPE